MKKVLFYTLSFFIILSSSTSAYSQENLSGNNTQKKNAINGTVGYWVLGGTANAGYARLVGENNDKFFKSYWLGADVGVGVLWTSTWRYINMGLTALSGSNNNHFELSVGLTTSVDTYSYENREPGNPVNYWLSLRPSGSLGYRFQKPDGSFYFRTGIGVPDGLFVGIGFRF
ncbi:hypothetical protein ACFLT1_07505 [Bacteroidota bacterium]